jgi:hypothetical protein
VNSTSRTPGPSSPTGPKPIDITPEQSLIVLEVAWHVATKLGGDLWKEFPIDYRVPERIATGDLAWLKGYVFAWRGLEDRSDHPALLVQRAPPARPAHRLRGGQDQDAAEASARRADTRRRRTTTPAPIPCRRSYTPAIADGLAEQLERDGKYITDFLNPPFMIEPAKQREAEDRIARNRERELEQKREAEVRAEKERARKAASSQVRDLGLKFEDKAVATPSAVSDTLAAYGHPLPWCWTRPDEDEDYRILTDANGATIELEYDADDLLALIMAAVNAAGGHAPAVKEPEVEPDGDRGPDSDDNPAREAADRPEFVSWIAERIQQLLPHWKSERCRAKAGHALDEFLKLEGCEFGEDGLTTWMRVDAHDIADGYVADQGDGDSHLDDQDQADAPEGDAEFEEA